MIVQITIPDDVFNSAFGLTIKKSVSDEDNLRGFTREVIGEEVDMTQVMAKSYLKYSEKYPVMKELLEISDDPEIAIKEMVKKLESRQKAEAAKKPTKKAPAKSTKKAEAAKKPTKKALSPTLDRLKKEAGRKPAKKAPAKKRGGRK